jgi:hypothetical protein
LKEIQTTTGHGRERGCSGVSDKRKRIDTLGIGETFAIAGFSFRVENKLPPTIKKARASHYDSAPRGEKGRNYPDLAYVVGLLGRKNQKCEKSRSDRSENRNRPLIQADLL